MTSVAETSSLPRATSREWIGLCVLSIACMLYSMDLTVLFLAIPSITAELNPSPTQLLWMNDIYGFMVAGFLVTMGTLGDRIGRRKVLLYGAAAFGVASILCAYAATANQLIIARALLGIAGATIAPSTLSLIVNMFPHEDEKVRAISIWGTAFALGGTAGSAIGGVLLTWFHWGSVFLINVPIMAALLLAAPRTIPEFKTGETHRLDLLSVLLSLGAVLPVIYGLKSLAAYGLSLSAFAAIVVGFAVGTIFIQRQRKLEHPLIDLALFQSARFNMALMANLTGILFIFAIFMLQNQYLQQVVGLTPLQAGLWSLPHSLVFVVMSMQAHRVIAWLGAERTVVWGLVVFGLGAAAVGVATAFQSLYFMLAMNTLLALGFVPVILTTTNLIVSSAPPERAGSASAISETSAEFGGALGIALLGSLATFVYRSAMTNTEAPVAAKATLGGAIEEAVKLGDPAWLAQAQAAFASGYALVSAIAAVAIIMLSVIAARVFVPARA